MKLYFLFITCILTQNILSAVRIKENAKSYYEFINKAESYITKSKLDSAKKYYIQAFSIAKRYKFISSQDTQNYKLVCKLLATKSINFATQKEDKESENFIDSLFNEDQNDRKKLRVRIDYANFNKQLSDSIEKVIRKFDLARYRLFKYKFNKLLPYYSSLNSNSQSNLNTLFLHFSAIPEISKELKSYLVVNIANFRIDPREQMQTLASLKENVESDLLPFKCKVINTTSNKSNLDTTQYYIFNLNNNDIVKINNSRKVYCLPTVYNQLENICYMISVNPSFNLFGKGENAYVFNEMEEAVLMLKNARKLNCK